ncbi:hypothetical protein MNEG_15055 [Monoraphidium neglectum]|uniref:Bromo domain-containing protein n=1 Tax=Monoraphidium neglectum TaxID=145388 RepID=A0A0D2KA24_9CHLO|nr:hypothetical protein MNEG_15055 [Monoraphidium neglectum]KIY92908.1 hypothetical protein MNEG_15055 [Monoraphidium neglectum]|eukprot:XP_013891928.1 hypothetical protein MNEG_15055 [Monoraphidium neglectum]
MCSQPPPPPPPSLSLFDGPPPSLRDLQDAQKELNALLLGAIAAARKADTEGWFEVQVDQQYVPDYNDWVPRDRETWLRRIQKRVHMSMVRSTEELLAQMRALADNARAYNTPGNGEWGSEDVIRAADAVLQAAEAALQRISAAALPHEQVIAHHYAAQAAADDSRRGSSSGGGGGGARRAATSGSGSGSDDEWAEHDSSGSDDEWTAPARAGSGGGAAAWAPQRLPARPAPPRGPRRPQERPTRVYRLVPAAVLHAGPTTGQRAPADSRVASGQLRVTMEDWMPPPMPVAEWAATQERRGGIWCGTATAG